MEVLVGLLVAAGFGVSDFLGGVAGKKDPPLDVALLSLPFGLAGPLIALAFDPCPPRLIPILWGGLAGAGAGIGMTLLYSGLARGAMVTVAPLSAISSAILPVAVGLGEGQPLPLYPGVGIVVAILAVAALSYHGANMTHWVLALESGVAFGVVFIALYQAGWKDSTWPLIATQVGSAIVLLGWRGLPLFACDSAFAKNGSARITLRNAWSIAGLIGVVLGATYVAYLRGTNLGSLAVISVLAAMAPSVTLLCSRVLLRERMTRIQLVGLVLAGGAVALLSL